MQDLGRSHRSTVPRPAGLRAAVAADARGLVAKRERWKGTKGSCEPLSRWPSARAMTPSLAAEQLAKAGDAHRETHALQRLEEVGDASRRDRKSAAWRVTATRTKAGALSMSSMTKSSGCLACRCWTAPRPRSGSQRGSVMMAEAPLWIAAASTCRSSRSGSASDSTRPSSPASRGSRDRRVHQLPRPLQWLLQLGAPTHDAEETLVEDCVGPSGTDDSRARDADQQVAKRCRGGGRRRRR